MRGILWLTVGKVGGWFGKVGGWVGVKKEQSLWGGERGEGHTKVGGNSVHTKVGVEEEEEEQKRGTCVWAPFLPSFRLCGVRRLPACSVGE